ncbi:MAG: flagellar biosynthesis protein FlgD [Alphaproteobacteria bacterium]|nr:flagellar biosynthesis protein FlgD [Alphaproteobacteria bacterium]|tara:strand:- start:7084 stop:7770 length:687 start_codon:yes stop_codon:yes gene_type:complete
MSTVASATAAQASTNPASTSPATQKFGEEFTSFIKLLTAQVQNQDPLAPMDSTQFVDQLATFSSLEQQVRTNDSLGGISSLIGDLHTMFASEWLGEKVTIESSWVPYSGSEIEYQDSAPADADKAYLTVRDPDGELVWSETLDLDENVHSWNGQTSSGDPAAPDTVYEFNIDYYRGAEYLGLGAPQIITTITDVGTENGALRFGTDSHLTADLYSVQKFKAPAESSEE